MRKVYTSFILLITMLFGAMTIAQEGQKNYINYQGVARNADGNLMSGESLTIGVKLDFGSSGASFEETHDLTTDSNGVFSLLIGKGNVLSGEYATLPWGDFATSATVSINGNEIGTTELMAVPHALSSADNQWHSMGDDIENKNGGNVFVTGSLYASKDLSLAEGAAVNEFSTDITLGGNSDEIVPTQKAIKTYVDSQLGGGGGADDQTAAEVAYDNSTSGLAATTAQTAIDELVSSGAVDADSDPNNEIQTLSFDGVTNELTLTDGGSVILPSGAASVDADSDPTNEIQDISLSGTELTISDGSTIDLAPIVPPGGTDDQNADEVPYDNTTSGLTASDAQAAIDELASGGLVDTDDQDLVLTGDVLTIEDGIGSVDLSAYKDVDVTTKTGILLGDGTAISGLIGTVDGQVAKWNAGTSMWEAGTDATGGGGSSLWTDNGGDIYFDSGKVGIGLTNPNAMHQLHSATDKSFTHFTTDATGKALNDGLSIGIVDDFHSEIMNHEKSKLNFGSYNNTVMTVHYNGRVGIGDDEPESLLDVDGAIRSRDLIGGGNVTADISGNLILGPGGGGSSLWSENGNDIENGNSGNVGIGTNSSGAKVHVMSNSTVAKPNIKIEEQGSDYARLELTNEVSSSLWHVAGLAANTPSNARLNFYFNNSGAGSNLMTITGDKKVGINGTPTARLHIHQSSQTVGTGLRFSDNTSNLDWDITHGFGLRFHYGGTLMGLISATTGAYIQSSDRRLKTDIANLGSVLNKVNQLKPSTYRYKSDSSNTSTIGLIAQEVEWLFPEIVTKSSEDGMLGLDYNAFGIVAIKAIQEQQEIIDQQSEKISDLEERLKRLEAKIGN